MPLNNAPCTVSPVLSLFHCLIYKPYILAVTTTVDQILVLCYWVSFWGTRVQPTLIVVNIVTRSFRLILRFARWRLLGTSKNLPQELDSLQSVTCYFELVFWCTWLEVDCQILIRFAWNEWRLLIDSPIKSVFCVSSSRLGRLRKKRGRRKLSLF